MGVHQAFEGFDDGEEGRAKVRIIDPTSSDEGSITFRPSSCVRDGGSELLLDDSILQLREEREFKL